MLTSEVVRHYVVIGVTMWPNIVALVAVSHYLFCLSGLVINDPQTGTSTWPSGWFRVYILTVTHRSVPLLILLMMPHSLTLYFGFNLRLVLFSFLHRLPFRSSVSFAVFSCRPGRDKFVEVDLKSVCKHCYDRLPEELKRRLAKRERDARERKKKNAAAAAVCL